MKNKAHRILPYVLLTGVFTSLFLPYFETLTDGMEREGPAYVSVRPNYQLGWNAGGFYTSYNGFGSIHALFNCTLSVILTIKIAVRKRNRALRVGLIILFMVSHLLLGLGAIMAPYALAEPDKMLFGYILLAVCEIALFIIDSFQRSKGPAIANKELDLLDSEDILGN